VLRGQYNTIGYHPNRYHAMIITSHLRAFESGRVASLVYRTSGTTPKTNN